VARLVEDLHAADRALHLHLERTRINRIQEPELQIEERAEVDPPQGTVRRAQSSNERFAEDNMAGIGGKRSINISGPTGEMMAEPIAQQIARRRTRGLAAVAGRELREDIGEKDLPRIM
jgi:hypothetical protein